MVSVNFPPVTSARSMAPARTPQRIVLVAPTLTHRLGRDLHPPAEVAGLNPGDLLQGHPGRP